MAIKPSVDRLGKIFSSFDEYTAPLKQAPFLQPWSRFLDTYFRYEIEEIDGGVRSRTPSGAIREEIANIRHFQSSRFYSKISCPVLILRAPQGILSEEDAVLTEGAVQKMVREMPHAESVDVAGTNHYSILFQANESRESAIRNFWKNREVGA